MEFLKKDALVLSGKKNIKRWPFFIISNKLERYIKLNGHRRNIYCSVNSYDGDVDVRNVIFEWVFVDFDPVKDDDGNILDDVKPFTDCKKVANYLYTNSLSFFVNFSGNGFHIFIQTQKTRWSFDLSFKLRQFVEDIMRETEAKCDMQVVGDLNRVARVPGTINTKTNLYCIPLTYEELMSLSLEEIKKLSEKPREKENLINGVLSDIDAVQVEIKTETFIYDERQSIYKFRNINIQTPPCINEILKNTNAGWRDRFILITFLRDYGFSQNEVELFLEEILNSEKFNHCVHEESQVSYLFGRNDLLFPNCITLKKENYCCGANCGFELYF